MLAARVLPRMLWPERLTQAEYKGAVDHTMVLRWAQGATPTLEQRCRQLWRPRTKRRIIHQRAAFSSVEPSASGRVLATSYWRTRGGGRWPTTAEQPVLIRDKCGKSGMGHSVSCSLEDGVDRDREEAGGGGDDRRYPHLWRQRQSQIDAEDLRLLARAA